MKKRVKRALSVLLVSFLFTQEVLADVDAAAPASSFVATVSDAEYMDGEVQSYSEYMPDNILSRYEESFEYCPLTPNDVLNPRTRIALADDVVVLVLCCLAAACGVLLPKAADTVASFFTPFDTWLRQTYGNVAAIMTAWSSVLNGKLGAQITGLKTLLPKFQEYMRSHVTGFGTGDVEISYNTGLGVLKDGPYALPVISDSQLKNYIFSFVAPSEPNVIYDKFNGSGVSVSVVTALYVSSSYIYVCGFSDNGYYNSYGSSNSYAWRLAVGDGNYKYSDGFSKLIFSTAFKGLSSDEVIQYIANCSPYPVFLDGDYARSYSKYGTLDGLVTPDPDFTITTTKAWSDLQQDFLTRWAVSDTLNIPNTQAEFDALYDALTKSTTGTDVITNLNTVWTITDNNGGDVVVPPSAAYSSLCYILSALAGYAGVTLTDAQKDSFITSFYTGNIDGTAALVDEQAQAIVRNFVVINGGSQSPDDNNDNNKYKVLKKLAVSLGAFLVSAGLVSDSPDFDNEPSVSNNVQVVEKQSPDVPTPSPDTGTDLTGVLGYLKQFLDILLAWANPLSLMDSLVSKLGLPTISDGIKSTIKTLPKLISGELTLPELFGNVTDAIFSMPQQVADAIAHALGMETGLEDVLTTVLELLGLSGLYNLTADIYNWLLSNNFVDLSGLQKLLSDIKNGILSIPDAMTNILNEIRSIPGQITDFFTIDTAVLSDAFADLQTTFVSRFSGISQLASVFNRDYSFNTVYPVIKMQIPEDPPILRQMFDGKSEIVFLDLNPFAENLAYVRSIIVAMLYVAFAFWFLGEFDVKFHIG